MSATGLGEAVGGARSPRIKHCMSTSEQNIIFSLLFTRASRSSDPEVQGSSKKVAAVTSDPARAQQPSRVRFLGARALMGQAIYLC